MCEADLGLGAPMDDVDLNLGQKTPPPRSQGPVWLRLPEEVYLGFERGKAAIGSWPNEDSATHWACEAPSDRIILGPITLDAAAQLLRPEIIPMKKTLLPYD